MTTAKLLHIVHTESSCGWGGQEIRILTEAAGIMKRGHHVTLICPPTAKIFTAATQREIPVVGLPIEQKKVGGVLALRRWLKAQGQTVSLINTHSSTDAWLTALACMTLADSPPIIRTRHVSSPIKPNYPTAWLYQRATQHIVTTGETLRRQLYRDNGFKLDSMTSVPTGIDLHWFKPVLKTRARAAIGFPSEGVIIGIVGTLRNWKGHTYLLEAFSVLAEKYPHLKLVIIGDGPQRNRLENLIQTLNLGGKIKMVGNQDNVPDWLNALDIFVLPSYGDEGVPQAIMQAMACGLPVVSTHVGGIAEAVQDDSTGLLVPPKNSAALAEAIEKLVVDEELRKRMGSAGLIHARQSFSLELMLDKMEDLFYRFAKGDH